MVELKKQNPKGDLVASSSFYKSCDSQLLIHPDAYLVILKSGNEVSIICTKTGRKVGSIFKNETVLCIWLSNTSERETFVFCVTSSGYLKGHSLASGFDECLREELPPHLKFSSVCFVRPVINQSEKLLGFVTVCKEGGGSYLVQSKTYPKSETLSFHYVQKNGDKFMLDFNENIIVKLCETVRGKGDEQSLVFADLNGIRKSLSCKVSRDMEITCIKCPNTGEKLALTGSKNGSILIWRVNDDLTYFTSKVHWHSLPVRTLAFSPDGVYFYSGGGEGAILKWQTKSTNRVAMVPRIGCGLEHIVATHCTVVVATEHNKLKIFSGNLEDDSMLTGLSTEYQPSGIHWHHLTKSIVLLGPRKTLQFFDPLTQHQKLSMEASQLEDVLGERNSKELSVSKLAFISVSSNGKWLATVETNWDTMNGNCLKIWKFSNESGQVTFECNTRINDVHNESLTGLDFISLPKSQGLLTYSCDGQSKLWCVDSDLFWKPARTFTYVKATPRCGDCSQDKSTIAISFDNKLTLWNAELLSLIATLSTNCNKDPYTSLAFASNSSLIAADQSSIHNWNLLTNTMTHKISLTQPRIVKTLKFPMIITSVGIIRIDEKSKLEYLAKGISNITGLAINDNQCYFLQTHSKTNVLRRIQMTGQDKDEQIEAFSPVTYTNIFQTTSILGKVKMTSEIDVFQPKFGPSMTASQISKPVSRNTLSILKQSLPS